MSDLNLPPIQTRYPATFQRRGVAVPFTTPILGGVRVRSGRRGSAEYILPNPSGGRGVYIVHWSGLCRFCHPTVHDTLLHERIGGAQAFSPAMIRRAARDLAREGYAGKAAAHAAVAADIREQTEAEQANWRLLGALIEQVMPEHAPAGHTQSGSPPSGHFPPGHFPPGFIPPGQARSAHTQSGHTPSGHTPSGHTPSGHTKWGRAPLTQAVLEQRSRCAVLHAATRLGCTPAAIGRGLTALVWPFAAVGLDAEGDTPRLVGVLAGMHRLLADLADWPEAGSGATGLAAELIRYLQVSIACARVLLRDTRALPGNMMALLRGWLLAPAEALSQVERLDWLLDGWEPLCLLWQTAGQTGERRAALVEIATVAPVLPPQIQDWIGQTLEPAVLLPGWRVVSLGDGWRTGSSAFALVARNEQLRALGV